MKYIAAVVRFKNERKVEVLGCSPGGEDRRPKGTIERREIAPNYGAGLIRAAQLEGKDV